MFWHVAFSGERLAVWRVFAWAMTSAPLRVGLPHFHRDRVSERLGRERAAVPLVRWEYSIPSGERSLAGADKDFVPARSSYPNHPPDPWQQAHRDLAGLFDLWDLAEWHAIDAALFGDEVSEVSLFGIASGPPSCLALAARHDQSARIAARTAVFTDRWATDERQLPTVETYGEFAMAMERLLGDPELPSSGAQGRNE